MYNPSITISIMTVSTFAQILVLVILIIFSFIFSSSETALTTVNILKLRTELEEDPEDSDAARIKRVLKLRENPEKMLTAILIGNNIVNLSASSLTTSLAIKLWGGVGVGIATGVLTFLILVFGEIVPKNLAQKRARNLALFYSGFIYGLMVVLTPFSFFFNAISKGILRIFGVKGNVGMTVITPEDMKTFADVGNENGGIEDDEKDYIHNIFDFSTARASEIMIPRIDMTIVNANWSYEKLMSVFSEHKFTRYPVTEPNSDKVIGILNMKDLLTRDTTKPFSIRKYLRNPYFTFDHKNAAELFDEMRESHISIAIVLDEYGATAGMITLEDLLEELVGEIRDEYDSYEEDDITQTGNNTYEILGSTNLEDVAEEFNLPFESEDYDTIGGYLMGLFDHIPEQGEIYVTGEGIILKVEEIENKRIMKLTLRLPDDYLKEKEAPADKDSE